MKALFIIPLLLCSCTAYQHVAMSATGNYEKDQLIQLGGSASTHGADGSGAVVDNQASFQQGAQAFTAIVGGAAAASVSKAHEATTQALNASNAKTAQQAAAEAAATAQAQEAARLAAVKGATIANPSSAVVPALNSP